VPEVTSDCASVAQILDRLPPQEHAGERKQTRAEHNSNEKTQPEICGSHAPRLPLTSAHLSIRDLRTLPS